MDLGAGCAQAIAENSSVSEAARQRVFMGAPDFFELEMTEKVCSAFREGKQRRRTGSPQN
jgi:hypothetical protein